MKLTNRASVPIRLKYINLRLACLDDKINCVRFKVVLIAVGGDHFRLTRDPSHQTIGMKLSTKRVFRKRHGAKEVIQYYLFKKQLASSIVKPIAQARLCVMVKLDQGESEDAKTDQKTAIASRDGHWAGMACEQARETSCRG